ncbi:MAG: hypothetical protein KDD82_23625 [Planctomycetes bacterium]|nr:hypothetical protein [Planctomycetota bacterium]
MLSTKTLAFGLIAFLAASTAWAQQSSLSKITWSHVARSRGARSVLEVDGSGAAELRTDYDPGAVRIGPPAAPLRGRLTAAERADLEAALRAPGLLQVPSQLWGGYSGPDLEFEIAFADGRPTVRSEGTAGHFGGHDPALKPIEEVLDGVRKRLAASDAQIYLEVARYRLPQTIGTDETLALDVSGPGAPGVEFTELRATLSGRYLTIQALGRQVPVGPAQPWSAPLRVERAGRAGLGNLHVMTSQDPLGAWVLITQSPNPSDGLYTGKVVGKDGQFALELRTGRETHERVPLDAAASALLGRFAKEYVQFKGATNAQGELGVQDLLMPVQRTVRGRMWSPGALVAEELGHLSCFGPAAKVLAGLERDTRVEVEGWYFSNTGFTPPRKWYDGGGRRLYRAPRLYAERIKATVSADAKLKRGWRTVGEVQPGDEVWVSKRRVFGWSVDVTTLDGSQAGRMRSKRLDYAQPAVLPGGPATAGLTSALSGAGQ